VLETAIGAAGGVAVGAAAVSRERMRAAVNVFMGPPGE